MNIMKYLGYVAQIQYRDEDEEFFGVIVNLSRDKLCFGGQDVKQLKKHMRETIDGYLKNCKELNIQPEKPYSGRITFRTTPEEHALLVEAALIAGNKSLNEWMNKVLMQEVDKIKYNPKIYSSGPRKNSQQTGKHL